MRWLALAVVLTAPVSAQPDSTQAVPTPIMGLSGSVLLPSGGLAQEVGYRGGARGFFGVRLSDRLAAGLDVAVYQINSREEAVLLDSGLDLDVTTTTTLSRIGVMGRYGVPIGLVRPYVEGLAGVHLVNTATRLSGDSDNNEPGQTQRESFAGAVGAGVGVEVQLEPFGGLHVQASAVRGSTATYDVYDDATGTFTERRSATSAASLSAGITLGLFRVIRVPRVPPATADGWYTAEAPPPAGQQQGPLASPAGAGSQSNRPKWVERSPVTSK